MRLPMKQKNNTAVVDDELATPLLRRAVDLGINYFDTAWFYGNGDSQRAVGAALNPVRDKVYISTKLPLFLIEKSQDFDEYLKRSLEQMDLEYLDFNYFHSVSYRFWKEKILPLKLLDRAEEAKSKGLIRHLSFSFHGESDRMKELIDTGAFSSILGQYNLVDRRNEELFAYAKAQGVGTAVMGPLMGGCLTDGGEILLKRIGTDLYSAAETGLRFAWSLPSVDIVLSGMSTLEQLEENVSYAKRADSIPQEERQALLDKEQALNDLNDLYCTNCQYCYVCPESIRPARIFQLYLWHQVWGLSDSARDKLVNRGPLDKWTEPTACTECGACAARCPQKIDIPSELKRVWPVLRQLRDSCLYNRV